MFWHTSFYLHRYDKLRYVIKHSFRIYEKQGVHCLPRTIAWYHCRFLANGLGTKGHNYRYGMLLSLGAINDQFWVLQQFLWNKMRVCFYLFGKVVTPENFLPLPVCWNRYQETCSLHIKFHITNLVAKEYTFQLP